MLRYSKNRNPFWPCFECVQFLYKHRFRPQIELVTFESEQMKAMFVAEGSDFFKETPNGYKWIYNDSMDKEKG